MNHAFKIISVLAITVSMGTGCSTAPSSSEARSELHNDARETIAMFKKDDPTIERFFTSSVGYAVYPSIGKGGLVVGGAFGRGELYENGNFTSYCDLTQGTIGLQIGGQSYSEIIFFENQGTLNDFKNGAMTFAAQASAVAVSAGAAANMDYADGVAVFVGDQKGLMAEASIGGQKFSVVPANDAAFAGDQRVSPTREPDHTVYGYTNEQDAGWRSDSAYNRLYDANRSRTIRGEVVSISNFYPTGDAQKGRQLTLRGDDNQTYVVHLGPVSYLDRSDMLQIRQGEIVTVTGSTATFEGRDVMLARELVDRDNERLELRDSGGGVRWNRN